MIRKFISFGAWVLLGFLVYATIVPIGGRPTISASAGLEHIAAFGMLGILFCVAYPRRIVFVCLVVLGSAALLELSQLVTPDRHARLADAIEKIAGGGVGITLGYIMCSLNRFDRWLGE